MHRESIEGRRLGFEVLEDRQMLAGNVTTAVMGNDLIVTGDKFANKIWVEDNGSGVTVRDISGTNTTVSGVKDFGQIPGNLIIRLGGGNDTVIIDEVGAGAASSNDSSPDEVLGRIVIKGGYGRDQIHVQSASGYRPRINGLSIYGGPASDHVSIADVAITDTAAKTDLYINLGGGDDTLVAGHKYHHLHVGGDAVIDAGAGNDRIKLDNTEFSENTRLLLGAGDDRLALYRSLFKGNVEAYGGYGRDVIGAIYGTFLGNVLINGNRGRDKIFADASGFGDDTSDRLDLFGGLEGDWVAAINGSAFGGTTRILGGGGRGFDNGFDDGTNTFSGPFRRAGFEGTKPPPNLSNLVDDMLAIN